MNIKRYEIYFADLNPTIGSEIKKVRSVVIISQDEMNKYLETIVIWDFRDAPNIITFVPDMTGNL